MHYYQHHIGDFTRDTAFLTNEEMGIYLKLIWIYYDTEKPLENNIEKLAMKVNSRQNPTAVEHLLKMFFELKENEWHHKRCEEVIRDFYDLIDKKSRAGKASAEQRKNKRSTGVEQVLNSSATDGQQPITHKPITHKKNSSVEAPEGVSEEVFREFLAVRKSKKATVWSGLVLAGIVREAEKAGISLEKAMTICIERSWTTFRADWEWGGKQTAKSEPSKDMFKGLANVRS